MRILITGGAGFVGRQLATELREAGHDVAVTIHEHHANIRKIPEFDLDITDFNKTVELFTELNPDVTIHTAALADADRCEQNPKLAYTVNVGGTKNVVSACEKINSTVVFISSSFVFSGKCRVYDESSSRSPINVYGKTKAKGEDRILDSSISSLIIRTDQPYDWAKSWQPETMVSWVLNELSKDGPVPVFEDWRNNPIYNPDLAVAIRKLLEKGSEGVFHVAGPDFISRFDWARRIAKEFDKNQERIHRETSKNANLPADRPKVHLSLKKMSQETGFMPKTISQGLQKML